MPFASPEWHRQGKEKWSRLVLLGGVVRCPAGEEAEEPSGKRGRSRAVFQP